MSLKEENLGNISRNGNYQQGELNLDSNVIQQSQTMFNSYTTIVKSTSHELLVDGVPLRRASMSAGSGFGYVLAEDYVLSAECGPTPIPEKVYFDSAPLCSIEVPLDLMMTNLTNRFSLTLAGDESLSNVTVIVRVSRDRAQDISDITKRFPSDYAKHDGVVEFDLEKITCAIAKASKVSDETAPTTMGSNGYIETNMLGNFTIKIFVTRQSEAAANEILSGQATLTMHPMQPETSTSINVVSPLARPFSGDDVFNTPLNDNAEVQKVVAIIDKASSDSWKSGDFSTIEAGSDRVTVISTAGLKVGMYLFESQYYHEQYSDSASYHLVGGSDDYSIPLETSHKEAFPAPCFIIEIISDTEIRVNYKLPISKKYIGSKDWTQVRTDKDQPILSAAFPETLSAIFGMESNSWKPSPITGKTVPSSNAIGYVGMLNIFQTKVTDPLVKWRCSRLLTPNPWLFPIQEGQRSTHGEYYDDVFFYMHTPEEFNGEPGDFNSDKNALFISPCGKYCIEAFYSELEQSSDAKFKASRVTCVDLAGSSVADITDIPFFKEIGLSTHARAASTAFSAGLITKHDLNNITYGDDIDSNINNAMEAIPHKVAMIASSCQLITNTYSELGNDVDLLSLNGYVYKPTIIDGGTNYRVGDVLYVTTTDTRDMISAAKITVTSISEETERWKGSVTGIHVSHPGQFKVMPENPTRYQVISNSLEGRGCVVNLQGEEASIESAIKKMGQFQSCSYPATLADNGYGEHYAGSLPMGAVVTINPDIDLRALWKDVIHRHGEGIYASGHGYEILALFAAIQKYGAMIVDVAINTHTMFVLASNIPEFQWRVLAGATKADYVYRTARTLKSGLRYVENVAPYKVGSPTTNPKDKHIGCGRLV